MVRRWITRFFAVGCLLLACASSSSCLSPTLPLPPPDVPSDITAAAPGVWEVSGTCTTGAIVTVFNEQTGRGVVIEDRARIGRYTVDIEGAECDLAWVKEDIGDETSATASFVLAAKVNGDPSDPPQCH